MKLTKENNAITLVALVITIIVMIILAAVSLNMVFGENGIITKAKLGKTKFLGEDAREIVEQRVAALKQEKAQNGEEFTLYDFWFMYNSETLEDGTTLNKNFKDDMAIYLFEDTLGAKKFKSGSASIANTTNAYSRSTNYQTAIVVYNDYVTAIDSNVNVSKNVIAIDEVEGVQSTLENLTPTASDKLATGDLGTQLATLKVAVSNAAGGGTLADALPTGEASTNPIINGISANSSEATSAVNTSVSIDTSYAKVDVIWIKRSGNTDVVTSNPYMPTDPAGFSEFKFNSDTTVNYYTTANTGNTDSKDCKWYNIKSTDTSDASIFVWIPRYAYRITYYSNSSRADNTITGYYDGYGLYKTDGTQKMKLESGVRTIDYNGAKYIIHPVFTNCVDMGGWDSEIPGFWFGKYEASGSTSTLRTISGVQSLISVTIDNMFTSAKAYNTSLNSHMVKNSEWGAVALLTESKYGRNGNEVSINSNSCYYTANAGVNSSTTGNDYGIYDMNGCAWEYVATYQQGTTSNGYGQSLVTEGNTGTSTNKSTKYVTAYTLTSNNYGNDIYTVSKTGDAIKEAYIPSTTYYGLHSDYAYFAYTSIPFFRRGGNYNNGSNAGVFCSGNNDGGSNSNLRFSSGTCAGFTLIT